MTNCAQIGDPTAAGNTCDDIDPAGCIVTKNLLVPDVSEAEIKAAVAVVQVGGAAAAGADASAGKFITLGSWPPVYAQATN